MKIFVKRFIKIATNYYWISLNSYFKMKWYFQVIFYSFADEETGNFRMFNFSEKTILKILTIHFIHIYLKVRLENSKTLKIPLD